MRAKRGIVGATYFMSDYDLAAQGWREVQQPQSTRHESIVYYLRMDRLVKIGHTRDLRRRIAAIGPQGVLAVELGSRNVEELRHIEFAHLRSHLEWFWFAAPLAEHIANVREHFQAERGISTEQWLEQHNVYAPATYHQRPAHV